MTASLDDADAGQALVPPAPAKTRAAFRTLLSQCGKPRRRPLRVDEHGNPAGYRSPAGLPRGDAMTDQTSPSADGDRLDLINEIGDLEGRLAAYKERCEAFSDMNAELREALARREPPPATMARSGPTETAVSDSLRWMGAMTGEQFSELLRAHPVPSLGGSFLPGEGGITSYPIIRGIHTSIPFWCESDLLANRFGILEVAFHKGFCWLTVTDYPDADDVTALDVQKLLWDQEVRD